MGELNHVISEVITPDGGYTDKTGTHYSRHYRSVPWVKVLPRYDGTCDVPLNI